MDADDGDIRAGIGVAFFRGDGLGVVEVGLKGALVAGLHVGDALADGNDFEAEFVTGSAWVGEEGEFTEVAGEVGSADAHAMGADEGLAGSGRFDVGEIDRGDFFDVGEFDCVGHGELRFEHEQ